MLLINNINSKLFRFKINVSRLSLQSMYKKNVELGFKVGIYTEITVNLKRFKLCFES